MDSTGTGGWDSGIGSSKMGGINQELKIKIIEPIPECQSKNRNHVFLLVLVRKTKINHKIRIPL
jgi:hypothetical protein